MGLRVLYLIDSLRAGGAERSLAEMLPGLIKLGIDPSVVCLRESTESVEEEVREQADLRFLPHGPVAAVRAMRAIVRAERPDLVHTTLLQADLVGRIAAVRTGIPVITSLVNTPYVPVRFHDPNVRPWVLKLVRSADGWTARRLTTGFHAITQAVKDHAVEVLRIPSERITVIERGRDPEGMGWPSAERRRAARAALDLDDDAEVLVTVGRQEYQKGQRYLLEAVEQLAAERPRLVLLLLGRRGAASGELDELRERPAIRGRVRFLGHVTDVPGVLAAADLFVFPSLFEGLGGSLIEAMALGLPIVASELDAIREVTEPGSNSELVAAGSTSALVAAIRAMLDDRAKLDAFAARSREIFEERFTLDRSIEAIVGLYHRLVSRTQGAVRA